MDEERWVKEKGDTALLAGLKEFCDAMSKKGAAETKLITSRIVKPARVPAWNKDISLEAYIKQV